MESKSLLLFLAATVCMACQTDSGARLSDSERTAVRDTIDAITERLATSISNRDAIAAADHVPSDSRIVYISDGFVILGHDYVTVLSNYYGGLQSLVFRWDRKEFYVLDPSTVVMVGWASLSAVDTVGVTQDDEAIFTVVYHREDSAWWMVTAHKTTLAR